MTRFVKKIITFFVIFITICVVLFSSVFYGIFYFSKDLPKHESLIDFFPTIKSRMISSDGILIAEYYKENRTFIPIEFIPQKVINAFLAAEDKNFFKHFGVDILGVCRSFIDNICKLGSGARLKGGSTITQQVAKNFFLTNERTLLRKIKEAILALRLEYTLSKERILEIYLNQFYFGQGCYGIVTAAKKYFNKSVEDLSIAECSYLAALVKGANNYHPIKNRDKAIARRNWVIKRQFKEKWITKSECIEALTEKFVTCVGNETSEKSYKANSFVEEVRREVAKTYSSTDLYEKGFFIKTTLNTKIQDLAKVTLQKGILDLDKKLGYRGAVQGDFDDEAVNELGFKRAEIIDISKYGIRIKLLDEDDYALISEKGFSWAIPNGGIITDILKKGDKIYVKKYDSTNEYKLEQIPELQGAILVMDHKTGKVLGMQGGFDFKKSEFNRATQAKRQIGSLIKPFVYLAALSSGLTPVTKISTKPVAIDTGISGLWIPRNAGGNYPDDVLLRTGIERSINTVALNVASFAGVENIKKTLLLFGVLDVVPDNLSFLLGACESTLIRVATAFAMIANGGYRVKPVFIESIQDRAGKCIYKGTRAICNGCLTLDKHSNIPPTIADTRECIYDKCRVYQIIGMLEGVVKNNTKDSKMVLAGKTGTSNDSDNVWFIGFSSDILVAIYVGYDVPKSIAKWAYGSTVALPMFKEFMKKYYVKKKSKPFSVPYGVEFRVIDRNTGDPADIKMKTAYIEAFEHDDDPNVYPKRDVNNIKIIDLEIEYLKRLLKKLNN